MAFYGDGEHNENMEYNEPEHEPAFYVDIPNGSSVFNLNAGYINVASFNSKEEAVLFCKKHFGADDEGKVSLISQS